MKSLVAVVFAVLPLCSAAILIHNHEHILRGRRQGLDAADKLKHDFSDGGVTSDTGSSFIQIGLREWMEWSPFSGTVTVDRDRNSIDANFIDEEDIPIRLCRFQSNIETFSRFLENLYIDVAEDARFRVFKSFGDVLFDPADAPRLTYGEVRYEAQWRYPELRFIGISAEGDDDVHELNDDRPISDILGANGVVMQIKIPQEVDQEEETAASEIGGMFEEMIKNVDHVDLVRSFQHALRGIDGNVQFDIAPHIAEQLRPAHVAE